MFSGSSQHTPDTQHATNGGGQGGPDDQVEKFQFIDIDGQKCSLRIDRQANILIFH